MSAPAAATYILIALWPINGAWVEKQTPATTREYCEVAARTVVASRDKPLYDADGPALWAKCVPGNRFAPGWDVIKGYNDR